MIKVVTIPLKITDSKKTRLVRKGFENSPDDKLAKLYDTLIKSEGIFKEIEKSKDFLNNYSVIFDRPVQTIWDLQPNENI